MRAFQVPGDEHQLLADTLRAGDRIDVIASVKVDSEKDVHATRIILRDIEVLRAAGSSRGDTQLAQGSTLSVLLAVTVDRPPRERRRRLGFELAGAIGGCVLANVALAVATRLVAGSWPDYETYVHFFTTYAVQGFGRVLFFPWSPAIAMGALYFASVVGLVTLVVRRPDFSRVRRTAMVAIAGLTGFGAVSLTYLMNNSHPNTVMLLATPAILLGALWLTLLLAWRPTVPGPARVAIVVAAAWLAGLLLVGGWPDTSEKWSRTLLTQALPGGAGLRASLTELWRSPPFDIRVTEAEGLLARHSPGRRPALVLVDSDLQVETLMRTDRINALPISVPLSDTLVFDDSWPRVARAVDRLPPGTVLITQTRATGFLPLQLRALGRIRSRFDLRVLERGPSGLAAFRLVPRSRAREP